MGRVANPDLPDRAARIFEFILNYKYLHDGNSPTVREIGEKMGIKSTSMVLYYLSRLEEHHLIYNRKFNKARYIEVVGATWIAPNHLKNFD